MHFLLTRYLSKQLIQSTIGITFIILVLVASARLVNYLDDVATGSLKLEFVLSIMLWRIPEFLIMILPLGFLIGIMVTYSNLYSNQEMIILQACGISEYKILAITLYNAILVAFLVAYLVFFLSPAGIQKVEAILIKQLNINKFEALTKKRFKKIGSNKVIYAENISTDEETINSVFLVYQEKTEPTEFIIMMADTAHIADNAEYYYANKDKFLVFENGNRYDINRKTGILRNISFDSCAMKMKKSTIYQEINREQAFTNSKLLTMDSPKATAELLWRISIPIVVLIIATIAFLLSRTNSRQNRFARLPIGILIYLFYLILLLYCRNNIEKYGIEKSYQIWYLHFAMILMVLSAYAYFPIKNYLSHRK